MLRTRNLSDLFAKRSLQPRLAYSQATPYPGFADLTAIGTTAVVPGMVAVKSQAGELFSFATSVTNVPFGLFGNYVNGNLDDLNGGSEVSIWRGGPDAEFEIYQDAIDAAFIATSFDAASGVRLFHTNVGKLTNVQIGGATTQIPVARLISAPSASKIIVTLENSSPNL